MFFFSFAKKLFSAQTETQYSWKKYHYQVFRVPSILITLNILSIIEYKRLIDFWTVLWLIVFLKKVISKDQDLIQDAEIFFNPTFIDGLDDFVILIFILKLNQHYKVGEKKKNFCNIQTNCNKGEPPEILHIPDILW